ncbi:MAG: hypothetical protein DHS20C15_27680 [Planctomycetota bacterium]|nr:MAG: hypothetical protein DHS20C15_27680 [Planctomycetota bacterium]
MNATAHTVPVTDTAPSPALSAGARRLSLIARLVILAIVGQTLFFKFSGAPESVAIFEKLGAEPVGRIGTGALEALALLLLFPAATRAVGAALALGLMGGAIMSHLTILGIEVEGDGGTLFALALVTATAAAVVTWIHRRELPVVGSRF